MSNVSHEDASGIKLPIRITVPLALLFFIAVGTWATLQLARRNVSQSVTDEAVRDLNRLMTRLDATLERAAQANDQKALHEEIAVLGAHPDISFAVLVDDTRRVIGAMRREQLDKSLDEILPARFRELGVLSLEDQPSMHISMSGIIENVGADRIIGVHPVLLGPRPGEMIGQRAGMLVVDQDLTSAKDRAFRDVTRQSLGLSGAVALFAAGLGLFFHYRVAGRLQRLVEFAGLAASGNLVASGVAGRDEIGQLGRALDRMVLQRCEADRWLQIQKRALDAASVGIIITDADQPDNPIIYVNPGFEAITGCVRDEALGRNCRFLQQDDRDQPALEQLRAAIDQGRDCRVLLRNYKQDGSLFWNELTVSPVRDERGHVTHFVAVQNDITDRKNVEDALRQSQDDLRQAQEVAHLGSWQWDLETNALEWSEEFCRIYGIPTDTQGGTLDEAAGSIHPEDRQRMNDEIQRMRETRSLTSVEYRVLRPDGTVRNIIANGRFVDNGNGQPARMIGTVLDVTELKLAQAAEAEAQAAEAEIGRILESSLNEIYIFDAISLRFVQVNAGARNNLGYTMDELRELTPVDLKPDFDVHAFEHRIRPLRTGRRRRIQFDTTHRRKDGSCYPVEVHLEYSRFHGTPVFVAMILDTTERKQAEEKLLQAERLSAIGEAMAGLVHESRNALARSQAGLRMLARRIDDKPELMEYIDRALAAQKDLQHLFEEVRQYAAPPKFEFGTLDLGNLVRQTWDELAPARQDGPVSLVEHAGHLDLNCEVDEFEVRQVFRNIFENALAACGPSAVIDVTYSPVQHNGQAAVQISVRDNGPGLDAEQRERIFDAFYTTKTHGTGLGMAIVKRTLQRHGGKIAIGSGTGSGAEFLLTFPVKHS